jgi:hypothetical protein
MVRGISFWKTISSSTSISKKKNHEKAIFSPPDMEVPKFKKKLLASVWTLDPRLHFHLPRKNGKKKFGLSLGREYYLQYLSMEKNSLKSDHFSARYGGSSIHKKNSTSIQTKYPVRISIRQRKLVRDFLKFPFREA